MTVDGTTGVLVQLDDQTLHSAKNWYDNFKRYVQEVLQEGVDYGTIAGVGKPSLLKPGAEKLRLVFGLGVKLEKSGEILDIDKDFYDVNYTCSILSNDGKVIGQCEGSAGTQEDKYLYRYVLRDKDKKPTQAEADELKAQKKGRWKKLDNERRREDKDIQDNKIALKNTIQKMAQKRAFVGAVLIATGGSEFFTQDVEDMRGFGTVIEAEAVQTKPEQPKPQPAKNNDDLPFDDPKPTTSTTAQPATSTGGGVITVNQKEFIAKNIGKFFKNTPRIIKKILENKYGGRSLDTLTIEEASAFVKICFTKTTILQSVGVLSPEDSVEAGEL